MGAIASETKSQNPLFAFWLRPKGRPGSPLCAGAMDGAKKFRWLVVRAHTVVGQSTDAGEWARRLFMSNRLGVWAILATLWGAAPGFAQSEQPVDADLAAEGEDVKAADAEAEGAGLTLQDRIKAVSRKVFLKEDRFELTPFAGISTNDAFFRRWTVGTRASYHLLDSFSIDVGGAWNAWSEQLDAVRIVGREQSAIPDPAVLYGYADAGVTFSPIYGKVSLMSEWIIHFDGFVSGGAGAVFTSNADLVHPTMQVGAGTRIFLTRWMVLRADFRDYIYPQSRSGFSTLQNLLMLNVGVGFYFPFEFEYKYQAARISS